MGCTDSKTKPQQSNEPTATTSTESNKPATTTEQQQQQAPVPPAVTTAAVTIAAKPESPKDGPAPAAPPAAAAEAEAAPPAQEAEAEESSPAAAIAAALAQQEPAAAAAAEPQKQQEDASPPSAVISQAEAAQSAAEEDATATAAVKQQQEQDEKLTASVVAYERQILEATSLKPNGPSLLKDKELYRKAMTQSPSLVQIFEIAKEDTSNIAFRGILSKMRIKKGLVGRSGWRPAFVMVVREPPFLFYFPEDAAKGPMSRSVPCDGFLFLWGASYKVLEKVDGKARIEMESTAPRKKGDGKKPDERTLELGFDDVLPLSRFTAILDSIRLPQPSAEVRSALQRRNEAAAAAAEAGGFE